MINPRKILIHRNDIILNLGYDYKGNILKNSLSNFMYLNPTNASILENIDPLIYDLVENVKRIKTSFVWAVDKSDRKLN